MPDGLGATPEEMAHYKKLMDQAKVVLAKAQAKPFLQTEFDAENRKLRQIYSEFRNPHIWGQKESSSPLFQIADHFEQSVKHIAVGGVIQPMNKEIEDAEANLAKMKEIRDANVQRMLPPKKAN